MYFSSFQLGKKCEIRNYLKSGIHKMGDLELFVILMRWTVQIMSPSICHKKRGKVFFFSHAVKYYSCAGAIRICKGFFADYGGINEKQVYNVWKEWPSRTLHDAIN